MRYCQCFNVLVYHNAPVKDLADLLEATAAPPSIRSILRVGLGCGQFADPRVDQEKDAILRNLWSRLEGLRSEIESGFCAAHGSSDGIVSSSTGIKQHPEFGSFVEVSSTTPLACTMEEAWLVYNNAVSCLRSVPDEASSYRFEVRLRSQNAQHTCFDLHRKHHRDADVCMETVDDISLAVLVAM